MTSYSADPHHVVFKPTIINAAIYRAFIQSRDGGEDPTLKNVLCSESGRYYELNHVIKKAIFGLVVHAYLLEPLRDGLFVRTGSEVAMKVYSESLLRSQAGRCTENPVMEIATMQLLGPDNPALMGQIECCMDSQKNVYSIMPFYSGEELFDYIYSNGRIDEDGARTIFRQLIEGMMTLHEQGIAHRDVSLENILFNVEDESCVIIDFGLCTQLQPDYTTGTFERVPAKKCGKVNYMSPELFRDDREWIDPMKCDMWSLGICLLYMLLGFPPLVSASYDDIRYQYITQGKLTDLLHHWDIELSDSVVNLIELLLQEEPHDRLSAQQVLLHPFMNPTTATAATTTTATAVVGSADIGSTECKSTVAAVVGGCMDISGNPLSTGNAIQQRRDRSDSMDQDSDSDADVQQELSRGEINQKSSRPQHQQQSVWQRPSTLCAAAL